MKSNTLQSLKPAVLWIGEFYTHQLYCALSTAKATYAKAPQKDSCWFRSTLFLADQPHLTIYQFFYKFFWVLLIKSCQVFTFKVWIVSNFSERSHLAKRSAGNNPTATSSMRCMYWNAFTGMHVLKYLDGCHFH